MARLIASLVLLAAFALPAAPAFAADAQRINGDVVALDGPMLKVRTDGGETVNVKLANDVRITAWQSSDLSKVAQGDFLGTTAVPQPDGTLKASEVHVFAESLRGTGEGHRPMDNLPGSTMTNATVTAIAGAKGGGNTMTNATVANIKSQDKSRVMTLAYKGGEKVVVVPEGIPVTRIEPGDRAMLAPGAKVAMTASVQPDGSLAASVIRVGRNGFVPKV